MKNLALLLLIPPLALSITACATSQQIDQRRVAQATEARTTCTANNEGPSSSQYGRCVNAFLHSHYGWWVGTEPDGSLAVYYRTYQPIRNF